MKIQSSLIISLCALILFSACDDDEISSEEQWKLDNEAQFAAIANNSEYTRLNSQSGNGFIMYKEIKPGDGATPYFTDRVKVLYTGWYKNIWSEPDRYTNDEGNIVYNKVIFDSTTNDIPRTFSVSGGVVDGFSTALQHMQVGDKWEIWIPWKLGYGEAGSGNIQEYTTLVFEIELVDIVE